jgi:hypothetical protein
MTAHLAIVAAIAAVGITAALSALLMAGQEDGWWPPGHWLDRLADWWLS